MNAPVSHGAGRWVAATLTIVVVVTLAGSLAEIIDARGARGSGAPVGGAVAGRPATDTSSATVADPEPPPEAVLVPEVLSVTDAARLDDEWFVLDATAERVHRLASDGSHRGSFARGGEGPGELRVPEALTVHGDTVVVLDRFGGLLHLFDRSGAHLDDRVVPLEGCIAAGGFGVRSSPEGLVVLVVCLDGVQAMTAHALLETGPGASRIVATVSRSPEGLGTIEPYFVPILASHPRGVVFGLAGDECLDVVSMGGIVVEELCHGWIEPVPVSEREARALSRLAQRARASGRRLIMPDSEPRFDRIFRAEGGAWVYRAPSPGEERRSRLIAVGGREGAQAHLPLPSANTIVVDGAKGFFGWEDPLGTWIATYDLRDPS